MVIKVVINSTFYKPLMWCYLCLTIVTHASLCTEKNYFYDILHQSFHHQTWCSVGPCLTAFSSTHFCFSPREPFSISYCSQIHCCFVCFCLFSSSVHVISSILRKITFFSNWKMLSLFEDFTRNYPLICPFTPGPPDILSHSHITELLYNIYTW